MTVEIDGKGISETIQNGYYGIDDLKQQLRETTHLVLVNTKSDETILNFKIPKLLPFSPRIVFGSAVYTSFTSFKGMDGISVCLNKSNSEIKLGGISYRHC